MHKLQGQRHVGRRRISTARENEEIKEDHGRANDRAVRESARRVESVDLLCAVRQRPEELTELRRLTFRQVRRAGGSNSNGTKMFLVA